MQAPVENVWDYPRPPRIEPVAAELSVTFAGVEIARTERGWRVLETSHPPTYYFPPDDVRDGALVRAAGGSLCEWKGRAVTWDVAGGARLAAGAAWGYPDPTPAFAALRGHVAFYPGPMDRCTIGGETVTAQPGAFYGGWITPNLRGPFKGGPGTQGW